MSRDRPGERPSWRKIALAIVGGLILGVGVGGTMNLAFPNSDDSSYFFPGLIIGFGISILVLSNAYRD